MLTQEMTTGYLPPYAYTWRPFACREMLYIPKNYKQRIYYCVIDTWTQKWLVAEKYLAELLPLMDGKTRLSEILTKLSGNTELEHPCEGYIPIIEQLLQYGMIYNNAVEHKKSGYPVYNKTDMAGFHLEITNACNMVCEHCYVSAGKKLLGELSLAEFKKAIDMLEPFTGKRIAISGGEPVANKDCLAIVEYCAINCGHNVDLYTNGKKFPKNIAERILEINKMGLGDIRIQLSLEGSTAEINDKVRGKGSFDYAVESLEYFKSIGLNRKLVIFVCLTKHNIHQIDELISLSEKYDVEMLVFSQWQRQGNAKDTPWESIAPTTEEWVKIGEKISKYYNPRLKVYGNFYGDLNNNEIGRFSIESPLFPKHLYAYNSFPRITPEGNILADQLWVDPDWYLGNVVNNSLEDSFNSPKFYKQLEDMKKRISNIQECQSCQWKNLCMGGSPGHTYAEYGHMNMKDLFCDARKYWFDKYLTENFENKMRESEQFSYVPQLSTVSY